MTSATGLRHSKPALAFTLIEVALALLIVTLVIGIGLPFATGLGRETLLRSPARELQTLALTARRRAVTTQRPVEILLEDRGWLLRDALTKEELDLVATGENEAPEEPEEKPAITSFKLPKNVTYLIRRWDETKFSSRAEARWRFLPTGLCEPVTVRFVRDEDFIEFTFNPLTAQPEDESFAFR